MIAHTGPVSDACRKSSGTKPLLPQQALLLAIIERDHESATAAVSAGAAPMALMRAAIEARQGYVDFLLRYVNANCKEYVVAITAYLEAWSKYPGELAALNDWIAAH